MKYSISRLILCTVLLTAPLNVAVAAPPDPSCARRFVGTWTVRVNATGQTYPAVISPGGTTHVTCPMCTPTGTWTCSGNTITVFVNGMAVSHTLTPDGRTMTGGCCTATRVGPAPAVAAAAPPGKSASPKSEQSASDQSSGKQRSAPSKQTAEKTDKKKDDMARKAKVAAQEPEPAKMASRRSSSCSDITGTGSSAPAASHCKDADRGLYAARQIRQSNPQVAAAEYKKAAAAARRAGDHDLELLILREAIEPAASVVVAVAAPTATPSQPTTSGVPRMWDGTREKCQTANELERGTAGWYVMCVQPELPKKQDSGHRPNPDPLELQKQARQVCGSYSRDTQQCFADFKLKAILEQNPGMREACEKKAQQSTLRQQLSERLGTGRHSNRERFLECIDNTYLHGNLDGPSDKRKLRDVLREMLNPTRPENARRAADAAPKPRLCSSPGRCCPPGHGMKPTPGAFGAWSCQPLGLLALNTTQPRLDPKNEADKIEDFEERVNDLVANAAAAVQELGSAMPENERAVCAAASLAAARGALKGDAPDVPEPCRAMANAARAYLAYYANAHVDNSNSAMEDLLASFSSDLGAPLPGMMGLTRTKSSDGPANAFCAAAVPKPVTSPAKYAVVCSAHADEAVQ